MSEVVGPNRVQFTPRVIILACILGVAAALRMYGLQTNLPDYPAWDEPQIVKRAFRVGGGDLNPHFFDWPGSLLIYANTCVFAMYYLAGHMAGWFESVGDFQKVYQEDPTAFYTLARLLSIATALATVWLAFRATDRLGVVASATAGLLIAVSPLHVRESAVAYTDVPATLFLVAALLTVRPFIDKPSASTFRLAGVLVGLGTAIKYYVVVGALGIVSAALLSRVRRVRQVQFMAIGTTSAAVGFVIGCPFSILAFQEFSGDLLSQVAHQSRGHIGFDTDPNPIGGYLRNSLVPAIGLPALIASCWGMLLAVRHHREFLPLVVTAIGYFVLATFSSVTFPRYAVPHVALVAVPTAIAVWRLRGVPLLACLSAVLIVAGPAWQAVGVTIDRGKEDTRAGAARWLHANVLPSARVLATDDGPRYPTTVKVSRFRPVSEEQFALVERGAFDVFVMTSSTTDLMLMESVVRSYPALVKSHLRLYDWVKTHTTLKAVFRPGQHHKGPSVEIYMMSNAPSRPDPSQRLTPSAKPARQPN